MNTFANAVDNQSARTQNGMLARRDTSNACVDLFFKAGSMRDGDITPLFAKAFVEDPDTATRIVAWLRDVRGGAGERDSFRKILKFLENTDSEIAIKFIPHVPELGRWDDLLIFSDGSPCQRVAFELIRDALNNGNGLAAKWLPREKSARSEDAKKLRRFLKLSPKDYRKKLSSLSNTVEDQMCANQWSSIEYSHVPSMAHAKYKKAFVKRDHERYTSYITRVLSGDPETKINAGAIFPHDVIRGLVSYYCNNYVDDIKDTVEAQWAALPNYINDANVLPVVDVSGSMEAPVQLGNNLTCLEVAVSLGLYFSEKNTGKFKDMCVTFTQQPDIIKLTGGVTDRIAQLSQTEWGMNTDLELAMSRILQVAVEGQVPQSEMPEYLLILSDMNFDSCINNGDVTALTMIQQEYAKHGYKVPGVIFWNICSSYYTSDHVPVRFDQAGTALISGFSPSILSAVLSGDLDNITPYNIMMEAVSKPRYKIL